MKSLVKATLLFLSSPFAGAVGAARAANLQAQIDEIKKRQAETISVIDKNFMQLAIALNYHYSAIHSIQQAIAPPKQPNVFGDGGSRAIH